MELKSLMSEIDFVLRDIRDILSGSWSDVPSPDDFTFKDISSSTSRPDCPLAKQLSCPETLIVSSDEEPETKPATMPAKKRRVSPVPSSQASGYPVRKLSNV